MVARSVALAQEASASLTGRRTHRLVARRRYDVAYTEEESLRLKRGRSPLGAAAAARRATTSRRGLRK
eukprot:4521027-Prymnesium_polylepis.1